MTPFWAGSSDLSLTDFEREAISRILMADAPGFLPQLGNITVPKRELSGVGEFVILTVTNSQPIEHKKQNLGTWLGAKVDGCLLGFILTHENGFLDMLEIFVHGNVDYPNLRDVKISWFGHQLGARL